MANVTDRRLVDAVLAVNYLMRRPLTRDEVERVLHAVALANYEIRELPTARPDPLPRRRRVRPRT